MVAFASHAKSFAIAILLVFVLLLPVVVFGGTDISVLLINHFLLTRVFETRIGLSNITYQVLSCHVL